MQSRINIKAPVSETDKIRRNILGKLEAKFEFRKRIV